MCDAFPKVPYPYPHETVFDGLDQMEYPMMVNDNPLDDSAPGATFGTVELTSHEIFHTYFPFYMGVNETQYAWMDEGWATFGEHMISKEILDKPDHEVFMSDYYANLAGTDIDVPMITPSTVLTGDAYWENSYGKPALMYLYLMGILGNEKFFDALHNYMDTWAGKHPTPYDFFNCMNAGSGKNLNWYFKQWFYEPGYPDLDILNCTDNGNKKYTLIIYNDGNKPVPVDVTVTCADNSTKKFQASAAVWETNNIYYINFDSDSKPVKAELNMLNIPDVDTSNNSWPPADHK